jgi:hypothetical protein
MPVDVVVGAGGGGGLRVRHNCVYASLGDAVLLSHEATRAFEASYYHQVVRDAPLAYWRLFERTGARIAVNYGRDGVRINGYYRPDSVLVSGGGLETKELRLNRSVRLNGSTKSGIDVKYHPRLAPSRPEDSFSVEAWARCSGGGEGCWAWCL